MRLIPIVVFSLLTLVSARADSLAVTLTGGGVGGSGATRGWAFSTASTINVTSLGWWDEDGDGLGASHQVGIWSNIGTLLMSATVNSGTTDPILSGFRFNSSLSGSTLLTPGTYVIGGKSESADATRRAGGLIVTTAAGIAHMENRTSGDSSFAFPDGTQESLDPGYFGPNFQFTTSAVPEPSAFVLMGGGIAALALLKRRKH
jgi:hypothetical protein